MRVSTSSLFHTQQNEKMKTEILNEQTVKNEMFILVSEKEINESLKNIWFLLDLDHSGQLLKTLLSLCQ